MGAVGALGGHAAAPAPGAAVVCHRLPSRAYAPEAESDPAKPAKPAARLLTCEKSAPRGKNQTPQRERITRKPRSVAGFAGFSDLGQKLNPARFSSL
jgi:hypothetical protein